ncbi:MAG: NADH-quinone oxidoreductase subunit F [Candidatus Aminicenantes bacterium]|nr:NADH-quinone oxidoreductase subunit NuoF [Candidatus Aminicenantes bacterium]OQX53313.1 MAG: NADH-quinone oxidoreductase subunit F [Candidatus Aminicenantes bacterium 4484_214]RLE03983.1 MAG: NADH-quinone oxidoreductase subunit F [Candidatus Aminicenantes bacterium]
MADKEKYLTKLFGLKNLHKIEVYLQNGGYEAAKKAIKTKKPQDILNEVKAANLRGRGGAGFPAGVKWGFVPQGVEKPKYLCVNADEGEPGTFKDKYIMSHNPHLLLEGIIITSYCVGIHQAFIYIRGEYEMIARRLEKAIEEATAKGFLGKNIFGSNFDLEVIVHRGAGAYICGEETALLESLEGKRGHPRLKPPFPASIGLFGCPTVINNVETIANIPFIMARGAEWFTQIGLPKDGGTRIFGVSGAVKKPGIYELPLGTSLRELIYNYAGGLPEGKKLKAVIPGGMSAPVLKADEIDIPLDFESLMKAGSMLGSGAVIVIDHETSMLDVLRVVSKFYAHESCGQCTPCRVGVAWINKIVQRIAAGGGQPGDLETITRLASAIKGKTLCPLGDAAAMPILAIVEKFKDELLDQIGSLKDN